MPLSRGVKGRVEGEEEVEADEEERLSDEGTDRTDGGRANLSRSVLRWERSSASRFNLADEELLRADVPKGELSGSVGVAWGEDAEEEGAETEDARLGVLPRAGRSEGANGEVWCEEAWEDVLREGRSVVDVRAHEQIGNRRDAEIDMTETDAAVVATEKGLVEGVQVERLSTECIDSRRRRFSLSSLNVPEQEQLGLYISSDFVQGGCTTGLCARKGAARRKCLV